LPSHLALAISAVSFFNIAVDTTIANLSFDKTTNKPAYPEQLVCINHPCASSNMDENRALTTKVFN